MECAQCGIRSSVGFCHECEMLLCEVCGHQCERCHKTVCRSHIQRTSSGRNVCVSCVVENYEKRATQSKELREKRAVRAEIGRKTRRKREPGASQGGDNPSESFSFESLVRGDETSPYAVSGPSAKEPAYRMDGMPLADPEALNRRVLTGSAQQGKPTWLTGLALAFMSWVFLLSAYRATEIGAQKAILTLVALILSIGTVVWTASGAFAILESRERTRGRAVFSLGLAALLGAILIYARRWMEFN